MKVGGGHGVASSDNSVLHRSPYGRMSQRTAGDIAGVYRDRLVLAVQHARMGESNAT